MSELRENQNVIMKYIMACLKKAKEEKLSSEEFCDLVDEKFPVSVDAVPMHGFRIWKPRDMVLTPEEDIDDSDMVNYLASIYDGKLYEFEEDSYGYKDTYRVLEMRDGFLMIHNWHGTDIIWYPRGYEYVPITKDIYDVIETENFRTPLFLLYPSRLYPYILRIGAVGYKMIYDCGLSDYTLPDEKEPEHENDFIKYSEE